MAREEPPCAPGRPYVMAEWFSFEQVGLLLLQVGLGRVAFVGDDGPSPGRAPT